jgi:taurine dioxygenase
MLPRLSRGRGGNVQRVRTTVELEVRPQAGRIGAEIGGVDLARALDDDSVAAIRQALLQWKVIFFRDQHITQDQHQAFAERFGSVTPAHPTLPAAFPDHPEILLLDNATFQPPAGRLLESRWHTDVTYVANPPMGSILRGITVPNYGGDTQWTNLVAAYEHLSAPIRQMIDGMHAVHCNLLSDRELQTFGKMQSTLESKQISAVHSVVRIHPETGERVLFVNPNFTSHIVELSRQESRHLLSMLFEHLANPAFTVRFRWEPGSMAFWDNRCTSHMAPSDVPPGVHRVMERITIAGEPTEGVDGFRSNQLTGDDFG